MWFSAKDHLWKSCPYFLLLAHCNSLCPRSSCASKDAYPDMVLERASNKHILLENAHCSLVVAVFIQGGVLTIWIIYRNTCYWLFIIKIGNCSPWLPYQIPIKVNVSNNWLLYFDFYLALWAGYFFLVVSFIVKGTWFSTRTHLVLKSLF